MIQGVMRDVESVTVILETKTGRFVAREKNGMREYRFEPAPPVKKEIVLIDISGGPRVRQDIERAPIKQAGRPRALKKNINLIIKHFGGFVK